MKSILSVLILAITINFIPVGVGNVAAATITYNAATGRTPTDYCDGDNGGGLTNISGSMCVVYFPIALPSGSTISSITAYYYDTSGDQYVDVDLMKRSLSNYEVLGTTLASARDSSVGLPGQIQRLTVSWTGALSSTFAYYVRVAVDDGTTLLGIKISYN